MAEFDETRRAPGGVEKTVEILGARVVHAALRMACAQVALVERKVFVGVIRVRDVYGEIGIAREAAALAAIRPETSDWYAARDAGTAAAALRVVDMATSASIAALHRQIVDVRQLRCARIDHDVLCRTIAEITARMRQGLKEADDIRTHGRDSTRADSD